MVVVVVGAVAAMALSIVAAVVLAPVERTPKAGSSSGLGGAKKYCVWRIDLGSSRILKSLMWTLWWIGCLWGKVSKKAWRSGQVESELFGASRWSFVFTARLTKKADFLDEGERGEEIKRLVLKAATRSEEKGGGGGKFKITKEKRKEGKKKETYSSPRMSLEAWFRRLKEVRWIEWSARPTRRSFLHSLGDNYPRMRWRLPVSRPSQGSSLQTIPLCWQLLQRPIIIIKIKGKNVF